MSESIINKFPNAVWLSIILAASITLLLIVNYCGISYTSDSHLYIAIAGQIADQGLLSAEGLNVKPPVYPLLIHWFGADGILAFNIVCFVATLCILFSFGTEIKTSTLRLMFWGILLFSTPLYLVHSFAWTEPPFITTLLFALLFLYKYQQKGKMHFLYISIILLLLLPFIRFAAVFILIPTFIVLFTCLPAKGKWILAAVAGLSILSYMAWVLHFEGGFHQRWNTFATPLIRGAYSRYIHNADSYLEALSIWLLPLPVYKPIRLVMAAIALVMMAVASVYFFKRKSSVMPYGIPVIFLFYYWALHLVFPVEYYSAERYLTPFYNLLIFSLLIGIDRNFERVKGYRRWLVLALLSFFLLYGVVRTTKNVLFWSQVRCAEKAVSTLR